MYGRLIRIMDYAEFSWGAGLLQALNIKGMRDNMSSEGQLKGFHSVSCATLVLTQISRA